MPDKEINSVVRHVDSRPSLARQDCHDGYHPSRKGIKRPQSVTLENKLGLTPLVLLILPILIQKPSLGHTLPMILGMGILFLSNKLRVEKSAADQESPRNTTIRSVDGYAHTWDRFMWLSLGYIQLSTWAPLCWEQKKNDSKQNQPNRTRNREWIPQELCHHSVILRDSDQFGFDLVPFDKYLVKPNGCVAHIFGHGFHLVGWATAPWAFPEHRGESASS